MATSSTVFCSFCKIDVPRDEIFRHTEEVHVGSRPETVSFSGHLYVIQCGLCRFRATDSNGSTMIEHCYRTKHDPSKLRKEWSHFLEQEAIRTISVISSGVELLTSVETQDLSKETLVSSSGENIAADSKIESSVSVKTQVSGKSSSLQKIPQTVDSELQSRGMSDIESFLNESHSPMALNSAKKLKKASKRKRKDDAFDALLNDLYGADQAPSSNSKDPCEPNALDRTLPLPDSSNISNSSFVSDIDPKCESETDDDKSYVPDERKRKKLSVVDREKKPGLRKCITQSKSHRGKPEEKCQACRKNLRIDRKFSGSTFQLFKHALAHSKISTLECRDCQVKLKSPLALKAHMKSSSCSGEAMHSLDAEETAKISIALETCFPTFSWPKRLRNFTYYGINLSEHLNNTEILQPIQAELKTRISTWLIPSVKRGRSQQGLEDMFHQKIPQYADSETVFQSDDIPDIKSLHKDTHSPVSFEKFQKAAKLSMSNVEFDLLLNDLYGADQEATASRKNPGEPNTLDHDGALSKFISEEEVENCHACQKNLQINHEFSGSNYPLFKHALAHSKISTLRCFDCKVKLKSPQALKTHMKNFGCSGQAMHSLDAEETAKILIALELCFPKFKWPKRLRNFTYNGINLSEHLNNAEILEPLLAELKTRTNSWFISYVRPRGTHQGVEDTKCSACVKGIRSYTRYDCVRHAISHSNIPIYECSACPMVSKRQKTIQDHNRCCSGEMVCTDENIAIVIASLFECFPATNWISILSRENFCGIKFKLYMEKNQPTRGMKTA